MYISQGRIKFTYNVFKVLLCYTKNEASRHGSSTWTAPYCNAVLVLGTAAEHEHEHDRPLLSTAAWAEAVTCMIAY